MVFKLLVVFTMKFFHCVANEAKGAERDLMFIYEEVHPFTCLMAVFLSSYAFSSTFSVTFVFGGNLGGVGVT